MTEYTFTYRQVLIGMICTIMGMLFFTPSAYAAILSFDYHTHTLLRGERAELVVRLDTEGESINAVGSDIVFPSNIRPIGVTTGTSVIPLFVNTPTILDQTVSFSGIIPGGFQGMVDPTHYTPGEILRIEIEGVSAGNGDVVFENEQALKNDGKGTPSVLAVVPLTLTVSNETFVSKDNTATESDRISPNSIHAEIVSEKNLYEGRRVLIFFASDKETGVAYFEVDEGNGVWHRAESPYLLIDQHATRIRVKAVDYAGNITLYELGRDAKELSTQWRLGGALFLLLIGTIGVWRYRRLRT